MADKETAIMLELQSKCVDYMRDVINVTRLAAELDWYVLHDWLAMLRGRSTML